VYTLLLALLLAVSACVFPTDSKGRDPYSVLLVTDSFLTTHQGDSVWEFDPTTGHYDSVYEIVQLDVRYTWADSVGLHHGTQRVFVGTAIADNVNDLAHGRRIQCLPLSGFADSGQAGVAGVTAYRVTGRDSASQVPSTIDTIFDVQTSTFDPVRTPIPPYGDTPERPVWWKWTFTDASGGAAVMYPDSVGFPNSAITSCGY
jgi:hypothetical protein